jgi:hypothetical protein
MTPRRSPLPRKPRRTAVAQAVAMAAPGSGTLAVYDSPLADRPVKHVRVEPGQTIASLLPFEMAHECVVCQYTGHWSGGQTVWILRKDWIRPVMSGDLVEFHIRPQGGGGNSNALRTILQIVVIVAAAIFAPYLTGEFGILAGANTGVVQAGLVVAGNLAINAALPAAQQAGEISSAPGSSPSYNVALSGNQARLDGAIPRLYGYNHTFPDFAGQPYGEFDNDTSDQYYFAVLALSHGTFTIPKIEIAGTPLSTFADVEYYVRGPGEALTLVDPAVVTAGSVTGQELSPGHYMGAFVACDPDSEATHLAFDVVLAGLGVIANDGGISSKTVSVQFECRPIDYWGDTTGAWVVLAAVDITAATADAVRRSYKYATPAPGRYLARCVRTSAKDDSRQVLNTINWTGLRAYLNTDAPLEPSVTHIEIKIRASEQLNAISQRQVAVTSLAKLSIYDPETETWGAAEETRNPAWVLADKWRSTVYGDGLPDSRIDLVGLVAFAETMDARQDHCDIVFDTFTDSVSADQVIAGAGRAAVIRRNGVRTIVRDEAADLPVTAYSSRMMRPGSWSMSYGIATSDSADGYIIEYWSNRAWDWLTIECPAPGRTYTDTGHPDYNAALPMMSQPIRQRLLAVTGATHAEREGLYMAAKLVYRTNIASWSTELQGILPAYGSAVVVAPALPTWAQAGDVVDWDEATLTMGLSEPAVFGDGDHAISLVRDNGSLHDAITVTAGDDATSVVLAEAPDFELVLSAVDRERPKYVFGPLLTHRKIARMLGIRPAGVDDQGAPIINHTAVIEDDRVHTADNALLPGEGETQDPINLTPIESEPGGGGGDGGGSTLMIVTLSSRTRVEEIYGAADTVTFTLLNDGRAKLFSTGLSDSYFGGEWLAIAPTTTTDTALFEAQCTVTSGALTSGTSGSWLALDTSRSWTVAATTPSAVEAATFTIEIREVATGDVKATATINLGASWIVDGGA